MRRDQIITLSIVLSLTAAVLAAKAWVKSGGQAAGTAASAPPALVEKASGTLTQAPGEPEATPASRTMSSPTAEKPPAPVISFPTDGRPVLLFFNGKYGCWCEMREYEAADGSLASVPEDLLAKFVVRRIDIHQDRQAVHEYRVMFPPAVILLDAEGEEAYRQEYGVYRDWLIEEMTALLARRAGG